MARKKAKRKKAAKKERVKGMLLDAASLGVHKMVASEDGRYAITNVKLEQDGTTVATTGYMMVAVQHGSADPADFPEVGDPAAVPEDGVMIPPDVCADAVKAMPRRSIRPALANALVTRCGKDGVELATTDLSRTKKVGAPEVEGTFPDWRNMFAHENRDRPVGFTIGTRALKKLLDTLGPHLAQDSGHDPALRFEFSPTKRKAPAGALEGKADAPVLVRGNLKAERGGKVLALVASVRVRHMSDEDPDPNIRPEFSDWEKGVLGWEDRDDETPDAGRLCGFVHMMSRLLTEIDEADSEDSAPTRRFSDLLLAAADELVSGVAADAELHAVTDARDSIEEEARAMRGLPAEGPAVDEEPSGEEPGDEEPEDDPEDPPEESSGDPVADDDPNYSPGGSPDARPGSYDPPEEPVADEDAGPPAEEPSADDPPDDSPDEAPEDPSDDLEEIIDDAPASPPPDDDFDLDALLGD